MNNNQSGQNTLNISVRIYHQVNKNNLLALASVIIGGCFTINGIQLMNSDKGMFISMPQNKGSDNKYYDICYPTTKEIYQELNVAIINKYNMVKGKMKKNLHCLKFCKVQKKKQLHIQP